MFSPQTRAYFARARGFGHLERPTHRGEAGSPEQGHFFQVELHVREQRIEEIAFYCPRCLAAVACGGYVAETLREQPLAQASQLTSAQILEALGGLPPQRAFYPWLVVQALQNALKGGL